MTMFENDDQFSYPTSLFLRDWYWFYLPRSLKWFVPFYTPDAHSVF